MFIFDNKISIETKKTFKDYLGSFDYRISDFSFTSLYMWRNINNFSWQVIGDYLCIAGISHLELDKEKVFLFPLLTKTGHYESKKVRETLIEAKRIFEAKGQEFNIRLIPSHMLKIMETACPGELSFHEDRPNFDYVYLKDDLINLKGRKYHSKRNHLNHFRGHYSYEYRKVDESNAEEALEFLLQFNDGKELPEYEKNLLEMEEKAMKDAVLNLKAVGYIGGAIYIDGKMEALTIGGYLGEKTITVHIEKANTKYRGLYQAINNEFCKHMEPYVKYVNREEDMDLPGLRRAKLSYRPLHLVEKYMAFLEV